MAMKDRPSPGGTNPYLPGPSSGSYDPKGNANNSSGGGGGGGFSWGWLKKLAPGLSKAGQIAAAMAGKRAAAREAEIRALQEQDRIRLQFEQNRRQDDQSQLDFEQNRRSDDQARLDFERFNLQAPQMRSRNAVRGDIMGGVQDVQLTRPRGGGVQGGTRPSLLTPESRALGKAMTREALLSQMNGPLSPTAPGQGPMQPSAPGSGPLQPTPMPQAGALDKILTGIGYAGTVAGGYNEMTNNNSTSGGRLDPSTGQILRPDQDPAGTPLPPGNPGQPGFGGWAPQRSKQYVNPSLGAKFYAPQF